jgi:hypothetical protein
MLKRDDPVLLLGMHRSGTTLLAKMLAELGMHLGRNLEMHHESVFILDSNDWLLQRAHGAWDNPLPIRYLLECDDTLPPLVQELTRRVEGLAFLRRYVGPGHLRAFLSNEPVLWGWKDPRTTATWPLWLSVFPRARAITVHRNGIDVAASLWRRASKELTQEERAKYLADPHLNRFSSPRCLELTRAFELWEDYLDLHQWNRKRFPIEELVLCYEDLLQDPTSALRKVVEFLDLTADPARVGRAAALAKRGPRFRFLEDPLLRELYERKKAEGWMQRLSYGDLESRARS